MSVRSAESERKMIMKMAAAMVVAGLACSILTVVVYDRFFAQKVVAVDLIGYIAGQRDSYAAGEITAKELADNIEGVLGRIAQRPKKEVLVLDGAVAGNVRRLEIEPFKAAAGPAKKGTKKMPE